MLAVLVVGVAAALVYFFQLGALPIKLWDESRLASNALEMAFSGDYGITTYAGHPDLYNTKPPLLIWAMAAAIRWLGANEFAVRLPSALCAVATTYYLFAVCLAESRSRYAALVAVLVLMTCWRYWGFHHSARTGDYDCPLVLFTTINCITFYRYAAGGRAPHLWLFGLSLFLAIMTKSIAGLMLLPGMFLWLALSLRFRPNGRSLTLAAAVVAALAAVSVYYVLREKAQPGFFAAVLDNEIFHRYFTPAGENNTGGPLYYLTGLFLVGFLPWAWLTPWVGYLIWRDRHAERRRLALFLVTVIAVFLGAISTAATKHPWYALPACPLAALLIGLYASDMANALLARWSGDAGARQRLRWAALGVAGALSVAGIIAVTAVLDRRADRDAEFVNTGFLRSFERQRPAFAELHIYYPGHWNPEIPEAYFGPEQFYATKLRREGFSISFASSVSALHPGETAAACGEEDLSALAAAYELRPLLTRGSCTAAELLAAKR